MITRCETNDEKEGYTIVQEEEISAKDLDYGNSKEHGLIQEIAKLHTETCVLLSEMEELATVLLPLRVIPEPKMITKENVNSVPCSQMVADVKNIRRLVNDARLLVRRVIEEIEL